MFSRGDGRALRRGLLRADRRSADCRPELLAGDHRAVRARAAVGGRAGRRAGRRSRCRRCCSCASTTPGAARWPPRWRTSCRTGWIGVRSAGSHPDEQIDPVVVEAMGELGVDVSAEFPKPLTDEVVRAADVVVTLGCGDACPVYPGKRYQDWPVADPAGPAARGRAQDPLRALSPRLATCSRRSCRSRDLARPQRPNRGPSVEPVAVITDIHGNLPALEASLEAIDAIGVDARLLRRGSRRLRPASQRGVPADRGARDPDDLRQLRLRDRAASWTTAAART